MFPAGYNNAYRILQIPGYVVILYEMIHDARIIPLDDQGIAVPAAARIDKASRQRAPPEAGSRRVTRRDA